MIKVNGTDITRSSNFEKTLNETSLVYDHFIMKFDKDFVYYQITFNGTPDNFLKSMQNKNFTFDTQNKTWILK